MNRNIIKANHSKFHIGAHLSFAEGYEKMGQKAVSIGASTLQFFARNPRGARVRPLDRKDVLGLEHVLYEHDFGPILAHAPYTMNACSSDRHLRELSAEMFEEDLKRMELLPGNYYNLHPGSRLKQNLNQAVKQIATMLNNSMFKNMHTTVLLETMSGKGSEVGQNFEELKSILEHVDHIGKIGICMDTCHMWDSGYDIVTHLDDVLETFDRMIGLSYLKAFHINDSMNVIGSHKDRHTLLGNGCIGLEAIIKMINHPKLCGLPFILETPTDLNGHAKEIKLLRENHIS